MTTTSLADRQRLAHVLRAAAPAAGCRARGTPSPRRCRVYSSPGIASWPPRPAPVPTKTASKPCANRSSIVTSLPTQVLPTNPTPSLSRYCELVLQHVLAELEVRDAVEQDAAGLRPGVVHRAGVAALRQLLGDGHAGRARADDGDLQAARRRQHGQRHAEVLALVVGDERLELADRDRRLLVAVGPDGERDDALALAQALLRAEAAAQLGQVARLAELLGGAVDVADLEQLERAGDVVVDRAGLLARRRRALDAAHRLDLRATRGRSRGRPRPSSSSRSSGSCLLMGTREIASRR